MKKLSIFILLLGSLITVPVQATADLKVVLAKESDLPFELSPSKFSNSPSKFSNSISKFSNSPSKFSNSPSKFDNSPSKYDNSASGNKRLLLYQGTQNIFIGYYVWSDDGLINFFSASGERLFYSPSETDALFDGKNGDFCGTIASLNDESVIVLTEKGQLALLKEEIPISSQNTGKLNSGDSEYAGGSGGHWIQDNIDSGEIIILEDGSIWHIDPLDKVEASLWLPISNIVIVTSSDGSPGYDYMLINKDDDEKAHAKYLGNQ